MSERIISAIKLGGQQLAAVVTLPGPERYEYFIKRVADAREVWGLYQDGWALAKTDDGTLVFPMWPSSDYASLCAEYEWDGYDAQAFSLEELIDELRERYCIVIVTHSMAQAARVSQRTAFFHMGNIVETGDTEDIFTNPRERRTLDYITGRFG